MGGVSHILPTHTSALAVPNQSCFTDLPWAVLRGDREVRDLEIGTTNWLAVVGLESYMITIVKPKEATGMWLTMTRNWCKSSEQKKNLICDTVTALDTVLEEFRSHLFFPLVNQYVVRSYSKRKRNCQFCTTFLSFQPENTNHNENTLELMLKGNKLHFL